MTDLTRHIAALVRSGDDRAARAQLPTEMPYPLSAELNRRIGVMGQINHPPPRR